MRTHVRWLGLVGVVAYVVSPSVLLPGYNAPLSSIALGLVIASSVGWLVLFRLLVRSGVDRTAAVDSIVRIASVGGTVLGLGAVMNAVWRYDWPFWLFNAGHSALLMGVALLSTFLWLRSRRALGLSRSRTITFWVCGMCFTHQLVYWLVGLPMGYASWHTGVR